MTYQRAVRAAVESAKENHEERFVIRSREYDEDWNHAYHSATPDDLHTFFCGIADENILIHIDETGHITE